MKAKINRIFHVKTEHALLEMQEQQLGKVTLKVTL